MSFAPTVQPSLSFSPLRERYEASRGSIRRAVSTRRGAVVETAMSLPAAARSVSPFLDFYRVWLQSTSRPCSSSVIDVTIADLFSGCGGLSLGVEDAARAIGLSANHVLANDTNTDALSVFGSNFNASKLDDRPIETIVDGAPSTSLSRTERRLRSELEGLDLVIGGPPCQGNSDLNNHTRRDDPKNALYLRMARFVEVVRPANVVIENVPGVLHDRNCVVEEATGFLRRLGYSVSGGVLQADRLGLPQRRRRHFTIASLTRSIDFAEILECFAMPAPPVMWAIDDLLDVESEAIFDTPARHSPENRRRIRYLFDRDLYDLPDEERPDCHRLKPHSYKAVYGRMHPDRPAPTVTSGFGSTGQGRFVHPLRPRTLTPHEAARVQGFPDFFDFSSCKSRRAMQEMIGNAVPSRLGYAVALYLLA